MSLQAIAQASFLLLLLSITGLGCWLQFRHRIEAWLRGRQRREEVAKALRQGLTVTERKDRLKGISQSIHRLRDW